MAAEVLSAAGETVTLYERMPSPARKFLLAGRGGLNLTHSEPLPTFLRRYGAAEATLKPILDAFPPSALRAWADDLGAETFIGTSGRVFPKALKASPLLRAWLDRLARQGVSLKTRHTWLGWGADGALAFAHGETKISVRPAATILALGGASWPRLGSDGTWSAILQSRGVTVAPLVPANCGFLARWSPQMRRFEGAPLKGLALHFSGAAVRGEAVITKGGIEGGAIYALSAPLREAIAANGEAELIIDLRPDLSAATLGERLARPRGKDSLSTHLRKTAGLSPVCVSLLREGHGADLAGSPEALAGQIKAVPLKLHAAAPIERAISTAGGVALSAIDDCLMLRALPGVFAAGEMLDWEAPTGGYLLQMCLATGLAAGRGALQWAQARAATTAPLRPAPAPC